MKKFIIIAFCLLAFKDINGQHISLLNDNATWYYHITDSYVWGYFSGYESKYYFENDTVISNLIYKKLICEQSNRPPFVYGLIREDSGVYYALRNEEQVIMDFNLEIGDSVYIAAEGVIFNPIKLNVYSVDSILIGGSFRKRIKLSYSDDPSGWLHFDLTWIEGIGSSIGFIPSFFEAEGALDMWSYMTCFYDKTTIYPENMTIEICNSWFLSTLETEPQTIQIWPNPTSSSFNLDLTTWQQGPAQIQVNDIFGRIVYNENVIDNNEILTISLDNHSAGLYFLKLLDTSNKVVLTKKMVKQ